MFDQVQITSRGTETIIVKGKFRNIFAVEVGRYTKKAYEQRLAFAAAKAILLEEALGLFLSTPPNST